MGGSLKLIADFPGYAPFPLKLSDLPESTSETRRERRRRIKRAMKRMAAPANGATAPDLAVSETDSTGSVADTVPADSSTG